MIFFDEQFRNFTCKISARKKWHIIVCELFNVFSLKCLLRLKMFTVSIDIIERDESVHSYSQTVRIKIIRPMWNCQPKSWLYFYSPSNNYKLTSFHYRHNAKLPPFPKFWLNYAHELDPPETKPDDLRRARRLSRYWGATCCLRPTVSCKLLTSSGVSPTTRTHRLII